MNESLRVLHVGAHPADAFDHAGGTLANHAARGDQVTVVTLTHGVFSHAWNLISESRRQAKSIAAPRVESAIDQKQQEVVDACAVLGIDDLRFLRYQDDMLVKTPQIVRDLAQIVREVRPNIVITHSPREGGGVGNPHAVCSDIVLSALNMARGLIQDDPSPPHDPAQVFFVGLFGQTTILDFECSRFPYILIDITEVVEKKVRALDQLKTQFYPGALGRKVVECQNGFFGVHARVPYVEVFYPWRPEVYKTLPVSEFNLGLQGRANQELFNQSARMIVPFLK